MNRLTSTSRKFYAYLKKDTLLLYKRRKYLYTFILLPLIIASLFLFALNPSGYSIKIGICDEDNTQISKEAFSNLEGFTPVIIDKENCNENLINQIKSGKLDLGLIIPKGFSNNLNNLEQARLIVYYDNTDLALSNLISWKIDQSTEPFERQIIDAINSKVKSQTSSARSGLEIFGELFNFKEKDIIDSNLEKLENIETEFIINPIWTEKRPIYEEDFTKDLGIVFIFPILCLFIILMMASTSIIYDKNTNFITRVKSSSSTIPYLLSKLFFFTVLVGIQFLIILILFMINGGKYALPPIGIIQLVVFIGLINTLLGFIIGIVSQNEGIAVLFSLMISFPLMIISGIFFPIQTLPKIIQWLGQILPLQFQINASKQVLLFGETLSNNWIIPIIILFGITYYLFRKD